MPEIEVVVGQDVNTSISTVGLLEEYRTDFLYFRNEARLANRGGDFVRARRNLRSGLIAFVAYLTGLANRWARSNSDLGEASPEPSSLLERLERIDDHSRSPGPPRAEIEFLTTLASRCLDLQAQDEQGLYRDLSIDRIESAVGQVISWLDGFRPTTGFAGHGDEENLTRPLLPTPPGEKNDEYRDFEAYRDDPLAFQDPPATWGEVDSLAGEGRDID